MIALCVGLYLVAGVVVGGVVYAWYLKGVVGNTDDQMIVGVAAVGWPAALGLALIGTAGWLLYKGAEWVGERIMGIVRRGEQ